MFSILRGIVFGAALIAAPVFAGGMKEGVPEPYPAPAISGIASWINSEPLTMAQLKGKVVLIDFWAYSCVNCVRTLPYLAEWDKKYRDKGLVIIGMHAPEFDFEKNADNVKRAVNKWHIPYPVALDNDLATWNNFSNHYWPAHYLIDKDGNVVYTHFGEGKYDVTEQNIRTLLGLDEKQASSAASTASGDEDQTPETYLGFARRDRYDSGEPDIADGMEIFHFPPALPLHHWALNGLWVGSHDAILADGSNAKLRLHFNSKKVYLVLGSAEGKTVSATLTLNGKPPGANAGKDAPDGKLSVDHYRLYELVAQPKAKEGMLEINTQPGLAAYAFTFGD